MIKDDAVEIARKMQEAEVIVFATSIYYYEMAGQMKTLLDRAYSLYSSEYAFGDIYLLSVAAENEEGVDEAGAIIGHPALNQAYELGKTV